MLKYLFTARFKDGTLIRQTQEDRSARDPEGKRSQFYDVLEKDKESPLVKFSLASEEGNEYAVDLRDGHFEVNGVPFRSHEGALSGFKVIYFRQNEQDISVSIAHLVGGDKITQKKLEHRVEYLLGWETGSDQKHKRVMQFK